MRFFRKANVVLVVFLTSAAGIAKVLRLPDEVDFFQGFDLGVEWVVGFGLSQIVGGLLILPRKTRPFGAGIAALCFLASALMLFVDGNIGFAVVSLIPVLLAGNLVEQYARSRPLESETDNEK